jgi:hypothetical protein
MATHDTRSRIPFFQQSTNVKCGLVRFPHVRGRPTKGGLQMEDEVELLYAVYSCRWKRKVAILMDATANLEREDAGGAVMMSCAVWSWR